MNLQNVTARRELWLSLLALLVIALLLPVYIALEPTRIKAAELQILQGNLDEAMTLYAQNCAVCHGMAGEGIGANPPLNAPGPADMDYADLAKIITRGRYNTAMPAWGEEDGGPLSDYQVGQLVALVQRGDWQAAQDRVVNLGLQPLIPFAAQPDPAILTQVQALPDGAQLAQGITVYAAKCVACHGADGMGTTLAPAINDTTVREKGAAEIERIIRLGVAGTLMAPWQNALKADELSAAVALITRWAQVPAGAIPAPQINFATTAESLALGAELYAQNCTWCHGSDGQGARRFPALNVQSFLQTTSDPALAQIITHGVPGTAMAAWGDRLTDAQIQAIVGFIRSWEPTAPPVAAPSASGGGGPPWLRNQPTPQGRTPAAMPTPRPTATPTAQSSGAQPQATTTPHGQNASTVAATTPSTAGQGGGAGSNRSGAGLASRLTTATPALWDWRQVLLIGGVAMCGLALVGWAMVVLRQHKHTDNYKI
ncbi:MAG: c-type cytochrome [Chloroflexi bacterium]|nr:c-type cytochrome [Chloroflexota bacterium]